MKETTEQLLLKADRSIEAARMLSRESDYDFAASRSYYAMFYIAEALLSEDAKFHRWLLDSSDKRLLGDYEVGITLTKDDVEQMVDQAKEFLEAARRYLVP